MTMDVRYAESDYVSAQTAWLMQHPFALVRGFWYPLAVLVVVIIAVANHPEHWRNAVIVALIAVGLIAFSLLITRWRWHRQFKKIPWMQHLVSATLDGQGIKLKGEGFEAVDYWGTISDIRETDSVFVFFQAGSAFIFLPKREMSPFQLKEIRSVIGSNARGKIKLAPASEP